MSSATAILKPPVSLSLKITDGPHAGESFTYEKEAISIGRGAENDIVLPSDPKLSRNHIKVICKQDLVTVENLSIRNPIQYKDNFENKIELNPKDKIRIGETEIQFFWESQAGERTVQVGADTLAQIVSEKTVVNAVVPKGPPVLPVIEPVVAAPPMAITPGSPQPLIFSPQVNPQPIVENKIMDFKGASISGGKSSVPDVRFPSFSPGVNSNSRQEPVSSAATNQAANRNPRKPASQNSSSSGPIILVVTAAVVAIAFVVFSDDGGKKTKKPSQLKDTDQIATELGKSAQMVEQHIKDKHLNEDGRVDRQFESAQSYYIKGFRDYRQGQYGRAIMSFQASLSFDPNHVLSRKYLNQSIKKQSEIIQFNLDQARRYRQKNNFRLCRSAAQQVMILRKDQNDPQYKDAKIIFDECDTLSKGRF